MKYFSYVLVLILCLSKSYAEETPIELPPPKIIASEYQLPSQCWNRPLFEVEKQWGLLSSNVEVRFCHGMVLKSKYNENEIEGEGKTFSVTYADGSTEEICGTLVVHVARKQMNIYHPSSSKLPQGLIQPNGYNPSWYYQHLRAYDGRGYINSIHPAFGDAFYRNIYEYSLDGFVPNGGVYQKVKGLQDGQIEVVLNTDDGGNNKYLPKMFHTYKFTPFLSLQEIYTGKKSHELNKNSLLCSFSYYKLNEKPLAESEKKARNELSAALASIECERRKAGTFTTGQLETEKFQRVYEREFGTQCLLK